jgi:SAM-dependent methyltransferase
MTVDPRAASGFSSAADAYELGRPSYPQEAIAALAREFGLTRESTVLDLAAGTGKLTQLLLPHAGNVIAVEPSEPMRARLQARLPSVDARPGTAEAIPVPDASVDAVFVGQAFHWFQPDSASREIARVLVPGGGLALLWNHARWDAWDDGLQALEKLSEPHKQAAGPFPAPDERWRPALEDSGLFAPVARIEAEHDHEVTPDELVALVASWSWIANLPDAERHAVLAQARALAGDRRRLTLRYRTDIFWTRATTAA